MREQAAATPAPTGRDIKVGYVMSRFPKLTETFILYEMLALEADGVALEIFPLVRERTDLMHPEAKPLVERAHYLPFLSPAILCSQLALLRSRPGEYLGALWSVLRGTWGSLNFFTGALAIFPKTAHAARLMEATGITHVHCHFSNHPAVAGFVVHRLTGIPFSFVAHGSDLHVDRHMLPQKVTEAAFVVPVSEYNRDVILKECGSQPGGSVHVIHCGVDTSVFRPGAKTRNFTIACVGTLHEVKGQTYLIEACRVLREAGLDFTCLLVGDGPDREALGEQIAKAGLVDRVRLVGTRTREQVASLLAAADVLAAPSVPTGQGKREGIPVVLMEAMSAGLPVVASGISGIPELVDDGDNGVLVPPCDAAKLAAALRQLHAEPDLRARLGDAARQKVLREFDLRVTTAKLIRLFAAQLPASDGPTD